METALKLKSKKMITIQFTDKQIVGQRELNDLATLNLIANGISGEANVP
jgi:hypothetical protein